MTNAVFANNIRVSLSLSLSDHALVELVAAAKDAAEGEFNVTDMDPNSDGWHAYRLRHAAGPIGADLAELLTGLFADAMPEGGFEFEVQTVVYQEGAAPVNDSSIAPPQADLQVKGFPAIPQENVGRRVRITAVAEDADADLVGLTGKITHPFPGKMFLPRENYQAGVNLDAPSRAGESAVNLLVGDAYEFIS